VSVKERERERERRDGWSDLLLWLSVLGLLQRRGSDGDETDSYSSGDRFVLESEEVDWLLMMMMVVWFVAGRGVRGGRGTERRCRLSLRGCQPDPPIQTPRSRPPDLSIIM
jgi:hypothetical protein